MAIEIAQLGLSLHMKRSKDAPSLQDIFDRMQEAIVALGEEERKP